MKLNGSLEPTLFVIFGGAGDLTWRKLVPALYDLSVVGRLPTKFSILTVDHLTMETGKLHRHFRTGVEQFSTSGKPKTEDWNFFAEHLFYLKGDFNKTSTYQAIKQQCNTFEKEWGTKPNIIFYMATSPSFFGIIPPHLKKVGLAEELKNRLVVEKPIGHDLLSAEQLNKTLGESFDESQIFRIDHYLGKETVQNILALRFANPLFEPLWNRRYIDYVTITVAEEVGVEHRGGYYDQAGALRDMIQNHLFQLLCMIAMEPMVSFEADEIRNKKIDVLHAVRPIPKDQIHQFVARGQYGPGWLKGEKVPGYRQEVDVAPDSDTETFVALKLYIDNWRWQDVPFYLRTGKRLREKTSEVNIQFKTVPHQAFPPASTLDWTPASLILKIQPDEGVVLRFQAKHPGPDMLLQAVDMSFSYKGTFNQVSPEAYQTLLYDIMKNDVTLFMRIDQVETAWKILMPILEMWAVVPPSNFPNYEAGSWGPESANFLIAEKGHHWPLPTVLKCQKDV